MYDQDHNKRTNFFEIQSAFYNYAGNKPLDSVHGHKQFKRWEWFWEDRVDLTGSFQPYLNNSIQKSKRPKSNNKASTGPWSFIGYSNVDNYTSGIGRVNCMAFHPTNINTFWVGTPNGGVWKTSDGGVSWTALNDYMPLLAVMQIVIDFTDPNIIYIATGDKNYIPSIGILKSIDGGLTWTHSNPFSGARINSLKMDPNNNSILHAATDIGIYRSSNTGNSWNLVQSGSFGDLTYRPNSNTILYATESSSFFKSTDGGITWSSTFTYDNYSAYTKIATSVSNPNLVEITTANNGLEGIYSSINSGNNFNKYWDGNSDGNLLHRYDFTQPGGIGWYALAFEINPINPNIKFVSSIQNLKTLDNGYSWNPTIYTHADKHLLKYHPLNSSILFECNDGGIYKSYDNGTSWEDLSNGLEITQIYKINISETDNKILMGLQDNGTVQKTNTNSFIEVTGGDGMDNAIDYSDANIQYSSSQYGDFTRTLSNWSSTSTYIRSNIPFIGNGRWTSPFSIDPINPQTIYLGLDEIYKSIDRGDNWVNISSNIFQDLIKVITVAPSNSNIIYASDGGGVWKTINGGNSWSNIHMGFCNSIDVSENNANEVRFNDLHDIYESQDGGNTWSTITLNIPTNGLHTIISDNNGSELYLSTDLGIYTIDSSRNYWQNYTDNLPNTSVTDIEIKGTKLYAGTYGRGLWVRDLPSSVVVPTTCSSTPIACGETMSLSLDSIPSPDKACNMYTYNYSQFLEFTITDTTNMHFDFTENPTAYMTLQDSCSFTANCINISYPAGGIADATNLPPGTYYINIMAYNNTSFSYILNCNNPTTDNCTNLTEVTCGQNITSTTIGASNSFSEYNCADSLMNGNDTIFRINNLERNTIEITLSNFDSPLKLFLISHCDSSICLASGDSSIFYPNAPAGEYYIVVESAINNSQSDFDLNIQCDTTYLYNIETISSPDNGNITGGGYYPINQSIILIAQPDSCWEFTNWSLNGVDITSTNGQFLFYQHIVTNNAIYTANYERETFNISLNANINNISTQIGTGTFECGDTINISTILDSTNYLFMYWFENGNIFSNQEDTTFIVDRNMNITAFYSNTSSIQQNNIDDISIYPNPTNGIFSINHLNKNFKELKLTDSKGKIISILEIKNCLEVSIDLSNYSVGIYQIILNDLNGIRHSKKVIKN